MTLEQDPRFPSFCVRLVEDFPGMAYRCLHDAEWSLEFVTPGANDLLGYGAKDLVTDRSVTVSELIHPDDLSRVSLEVEAALSSKISFACIYRIRTRAGVYKWVSDVGRGVFDDTGNLEALEGVLSDMTAEVEAREAAQLAERRELVARLASGIAHDFNNLLTGIMGAVSLARHALRDPRSTLAVETELAAIDEMTERASAMTTQLLGLGRPRQVRTEPLDLSRAVSAMVPLLERLVGRSVPVALRSADRRLPCRIDPVQFEQVIINLAANARDAMPGGGCLTIALAPGADGQTACLEVTDTGVGIPPDHLDSIFEPYVTTKGEGHGTGLGLATVRGIVESAGGQVTVSSRATGTTFSLELPLATSTAGTDDEPLGAEVVLFAEAEAAVRNALSRGLRRLGYTVLEAADGEHALKIAARHKGPVDVLVTDGTMPGLDGVGLAENLLRLRPELVAILVTGDGVAHRSDLFAAQLAKPLTARDVAREIRRGLGARSAAGAELAHR